MQTYGNIPSSESILKEVGSGIFKAFQRGNHKRDLTLLVRGDISIVRPVCYSFFACLHCGNIGIGGSGFIRVAGRPICFVCEGGEDIWYFDGVGFQSEMSIEIGRNDNQIRIVKI